MRSRGVFCAVPGATDHDLRRGAVEDGALGRAEEAREFDLRAIALTANPAEQALLRERLEGR